MIGVQVLGAKETAALLRAASKAFPVSLRGAIQEATRLVELDLKRVGLSAPQRRNPFWGVIGSDPSSGALGARTGHTRRSVVGAVFASGNNVVGVVGSPEKHLRLIEDGGTITAAGKLLRIPTAAAQTASGADRNAGRSIRDIPGSFLRRSKRGNLFAFVRQGSKAAALYMLVNSVTLKARHTFRNTARRMGPVVRALVGRSVDVVVRMAGG